MSAQERSKWPVANQPSRRTIAIAAAGSLFTLAGCSAVAGKTKAAGPMGADEAATATTPAPQPAKLTLVPADKATDVLPTDLISISAVTGTLNSVTVTDEKGDKVAGTLKGNAWVSSQRLRPSATYTVATDATGPDGTATPGTATFATLTPKTIATYGINYSGMTVGVGMPIAIQFDSAVTDPAYRKAVEEAVTIEVTPKQEGSWGWLDNRQLMWRPKEYWQPGTTVKVTAPLTGLQTGESKWVGSDAQGGFTVGAATISTVDIANHTMTVTQNGKTLRTIPVSCGRNEMPYITRSGTKVIIEKLPTVIMDSATSGVPKGDPDYYREKVDWDLRVTWTGEYLHSAPWSVASQGRANVSHGCVNVAPENMKWMYNLSKVGDIVHFTGSNREFLPTEGIGVWQYSYASWQKQSALVSA